MKTKHFKEILLFVSKVRIALQGVLELKLSQIVVVEYNSKSGELISEIIFIHNEKQEIDNPDENLDIISDSIYCILRQSLNKSVLKAHLSLSFETKISEKRKEKSMMRFLLFGFCVGRLLYCIVFKVQASGPSLGKELKNLSRKIT